MVEYAIISEGGGLIDYGCVSQESALMLWGAEYFTSEGAIILMAGVDDDCQTGK